MLPSPQVARSVEVLEAKLAMPLPQLTQSNGQKETPLWSLAAEGIYGEQAESLVDAAGVHSSSSCPPISQGKVCDEQTGQMAEPTEEWSDGVGRLQHTLQRRC